MSIQSRFLAFHAANPHVYEELRVLALQARGKGYKKIGIAMLFEVLRWNRMMQTRDPNGDFKLNNDYRSRYARLIMAKDPSLVGFFELRAVTP